MCYVQNGRYDPAILTRQLLNSSYGLACDADEWLRRRKEVIDKVISYDYNFIDDMIKREKERNEMADQKTIIPEVYRFVLGGYYTNERCEIVIEKDFRNNAYPYRVKVYTLKDNGDRDLTITFGYRYWDQLETQLMYDLRTTGPAICKEMKDAITCELYSAKRSFSGLSYTDNGSLKSQINNLHKNPFEAMPKIEKVIFNPPATIVLWRDGTKTIVKCQDGDEFDWEKGLAMAYVKRAFNNERTYYGLFKKNEPWLNLPNSNVKYDPKVAKEVSIIVPKDLPVTGDIIKKAFDLIIAEGNKKLDNGIEVGM